LKQWPQKTLVLLTFWLASSQLVAEEFTSQAQAEALSTRLGQALLSPEFTPKLTRQNVASLLKSPGDHTPVCRQVAVHLAGGLRRVIRYTGRSAETVRDIDLIEILEDMNRFGPEVLDFRFPLSAGRAQGFPTTCADLILN
jgi:hypothetical protein